MKIIQNIAVHVSSCTIPFTFWTTFVPDIVTATVNPHCVQIPPSSSTSRGFCTVPIVPRCRTLWSATLIDVATCSVAWCSTSRCSPHLSDHLGVLSLKPSHQIQICLILKLCLTLRSFNKVMSFNVVSSPSCGCFVIRWCDLHQPFD